MEAMADRQSRPEIFGRTATARGAGARLGPQPRVLLLDEPFVGRWT